MERVEEYLEWFKEQCKRLGGKVDERVKQDRKEVECIFREPPRVDIEIRADKKPDKKLELTMCFGFSCARLEDVNRISMKGGLLILPFVSASTSFYIGSDVGGNGASASFIFDKKSKLANIQLRVDQKRDIEVYIVNQEMS